MKCIVTIYGKKSFETIQSFSSSFIIEKLSIQQITDREDNNNLDQIVFDDNNQEGNSWACLEQSCSRSLIVFLSQLFVVLLIVLVAFGEPILQKFVTNPLFGWEICAVQQDAFCPHQDYEQVNFYKKSRLYSIGRTLRDGKVTFHLQLAQKGNLLNQIMTKFIFFINTIRDTF